MHAHDLTSVPATDPVDLYRVRDGSTRPDMLLTRAGASRSVFLAGQRIRRRRTEICRALDIADRPADVMLTLLAAMGLVEERNGVFHLTTLAREHLVSGSPWFLGPYFASLKDRPSASIC